jgi:hypothetical protein
MQMCHKTESLGKGSPVGLLQVKLHDGHWQGSTTEMLEEGGGGKASLVKL